MELAISTEHHPGHVNAPEQPRGQASEQQQQTNTAVYISLQVWYIFSLCWWTGCYPITCSQLTVQSGVSEKNSR